VNVGLARGYMAIGDYKKAAEYAQKALVQAPDPVNKKNLESMAQTLAQGKPYDN
jgi:tetratricopeptide (TPR) repeat protein